MKLPGQLARHKGLTRVPMRRQPPKSRAREREFAPEVKRAADLACGHRCAVRLPADLDAWAAANIVDTHLTLRDLAALRRLAAGCRGIIQTHHHRLMRSHQGPGTLENCLPACWPCHQWVHRNVRLAYLFGWLVPEHSDEARALVRPSG